MIDDLDLAFDERERDTSEKGRHRRGYVRKRNGKSGGAGKTVLALLMALVLLGGLGGGAWYGFDKVQGFFSAEDYDGPGTGEALVEVKQGHTATDIANTLFGAGVVKSAQAFIEAAEENSRSKNSVGSYKVQGDARRGRLTILLDRAGSSTAWPSRRG
jgi:UPF0755 protein